MDELRVSLVEELNGAVDDVPDGLPVVERDAVRLVVLDSEDRLLLFRTREATYPELGEWWELPGGGIEPGETYRDAAVRELWEETGLALAPDAIGPATWRHAATYRFRGTRRVQRELIALVRLHVARPVLDQTRQQPHELEDYLSWHWVPVGDVVKSPDRFYPGNLPEALPTFLAGGSLDDPLEHWS